MIIQTDKNSEHTLIHIQTQQTELPKSLAKHIPGCSYLTLISWHISGYLPQLHKDTSDSRHKFRNPEAPTYTGGKPWDDFPSCGNKITRISHKHIEKPILDKYKVTQL